MSYLWLGDFLKDNLLYPKGPGSGAAQILNNSKSTLRVGTLSAIDSWESNAYSLFMPLVSDGRAEFRENVLRDCMLHLPIPLNTQSPMAISLDSIEYQRKIENQLLGGLDDETDSCHTLKRPFKPLFYTDSSLYCTSMPFQDGVEYGSPDDGLIIRPTKLGLFILHVTGNFPPTYSLNLLERCFQPFGL
ncbi:hypothetical protein EWB00_002999 [Schistosoma japonicum]|uniref:Uncharacterized protein n=2 Tax=Schistosoma japonicum TaxID=6182 RepID=A0A4Z2DAC9_SCHJA|nr:hypothetical protein EWB00_002999 [Schistosoma japonicum]